MLEKNQKKTAKQQRSNKASLPRLMGKWCAYIYFSAVKSSIPCSNLFFYTFHGHLSWFWLNDPNMTFCTARSVFATVCFNQVLTATKTVRLLILKKFFSPSLPFLTSLYRVYMTRFCWWGSAGVASVWSCLCVQQISSHARWLQDRLTAGQGQALQGWWNRRRKTCSTSCGWRERWEGKKQSCRHPGQWKTRAPEVPLQPMEDPTVEPDV